MKYFKLDKDKREIIIDKYKKYNVNVDILDLIIDLKCENDRLNNIIDNARKYIENNQSGCENENGHFHLNFDGDIWELYEMLRRF